MWITSHSNFNLPTACFVSDIKTLFRLFKLFSEQLLHTVFFVAIYGKESFPLNISCIYTSDFCNIWMYFHVFVTFFKGKETSESHNFFWKKAAVFHSNFLTQNLFHSVIFSWNQFCFPFISFFLSFKLRIFINKKKSMLTEKLNHWTSYSRMLWSISAIKHETKTFLNSLCLLEFGTESSDEFTTTGCWKCTNYVEEWMVLFSNLWNELSSQFFYIWLTSRVFLRTRKYTLNLYTQCKP